MKLIDGAVFDLDGTLIDSEGNYYRADRAFLARYGIDFNDEFRNQMIGKGAVELLRELRVRFPGNPVTLLDEGQFIREKDEAYLACAENRTSVFPGMMELVRRFSAAGIPCAIASGSTPPVIARVLELTGIAGCFAAIVSSSEVRRGKPFPDVFLEAARRIGVAPARCVVFEDSRFGVEAALRAGMYCVAVPTPLGTGLPEMFRKADLLFEKGAGDVSVSAVLDWCAV